ncbi:hypothetical protein ONZ45_g12344 [Pleurotus djamor]|nr:hypothetical protein ONZ45_g12344 [Pleurotus djamor]
MSSSPTRQTPVIPDPLNNPTATNHPKSCLVSIVFALSRAQQAGRLPTSGSILELCDACSQLRNSPTEPSASGASEGRATTDVGAGGPASSPPLMPHPHSGLFPIEMELALVYANCDAFRQILRSRMAEFDNVEATMIYVVCMLLSGGSQLNRFQLALMLMIALDRFKRAVDEEQFTPV